jgi:hypothetical protein
VTVEIQLLTSGMLRAAAYASVRLAQTTLARYTDNQGRPLRQRELCDRYPTASASS